MNRVSNRASKFLGALFVVILVVGAALGFRRFWPDGAQQAALRERALAMEIMGSQIATGRGGQRVLVVGNPFTQLPGALSSVVDAESASVSGLRQGLGGAAKVFGPVYPKLRPEAVLDPASVPMPPGTSTPLSYLTKEGEWDRLISDHGPADLLVSLIGIPNDLEKHEWWRAADGPKLALFLPDFRVLGDPSRVDEILLGGKIVGAIVPATGVLSKLGNEGWSTRFREHSGGSFRVLTAVSPTGR